MPANPNICVVLQCRQITFKSGGVGGGGGGQIFLKRTFIIIIIVVIIIIQLLLSLLLTTMMKWGLGNVTKPGTCVSIFQRRSGHYLLIKEALKRIIA